MNRPALILLFASALNTHAQTDSVPAIRPFAKNQFSMTYNLLRFVSDSGPYLRLDYRRLKSVNREDERQIASRYYVFSLDDFGSVQSKVRFDNSTLIAINDTTVSQRLSGTLTGGVNLRAGIERQRRLLFAANKWGGFQAHAGWYGLLGYSSKLEQYIHVQQAVGNKWKNDFVDWKNEYEIAGERKSDYLRIGIGGVLGLDLVLNMSKLTFTTGLTFGLFNINADFLVHSDTRSDSDGIYSESPQRYVARAVPDMGVRVGIAF